MSGPWSQSFSIFGPLSPDELAALNRRNENLYNLKTGDTAKFVVEFVDVSGTITIPGGGTVVVNYTQNGVSFTDALSLTQVQSFFTTTWGSSSADQGLCPWEVYAPGGTLATTGLLRIIN